MVSSSVLVLDFGAALAADVDVGNFKRLLKKDFTQAGLTATE
jgi:hypothetical protein